MNECVVCLCGTAAGVFALLRGEHQEGRADGGEEQGRGQGLAEEGQGDGLAMCDLVYMRVHVLSCTNPRERAHRPIHSEGEWNAA